jgi:antitoxin CptB
MDAVARNRLQWKCRRGLLELDLVLERFLKKHPFEGIPDALLDLPDNDLWDIIIGRSDRYEPHLSETVARLRAA